jgi:hypothetical protein
MAIYTILLKRGKSSSWASKNIILQNGEPGFEIDTGKLKIGNGSTHWNDLDYVGGDVADDQIEEIVANFNNLQEEVSGKIKMCVWEEND